MSSFQSSLVSTGPSGPSNASSAGEEEFSQKTQVGSAASRQQPAEETSATEAFIKRYHDRTDGPEQNIEHGTLAEKAVQTGLEFPFTLTWTTRNQEEELSFSVTLLLYPDAKGVRSCKRSQTKDKLSGLVSTESIARIEAVMDWVERTT
jgi:hypothetical protein